MPIGQPWGPAPVPVSWRRRGAHPLSATPVRPNWSLLALPPTERYHRATRQEPLPPADAPRDDRLARLEAALFVSRESLAIRKLAQLASLADGTEARTLIGHLNKYYDAT